MKNLKTLFHLNVFLGLLALNGTSHAAVLIDPTTLNGSFESPDVGGGDSKQGFDTTGKDILNWGNTNTTFAGAGLATYNDNGVDNNPGGSHSGNQFAFFHGGEGGAYNLTSYVVQAGDQFNLSWFGRADTIAVRLFSSTDGSYSTAATMYESIQAQPGGYAQYSIPTYTAQVGDIGKTIGISVFNPTTGYANVDDFTLTVTSVPEPSASLTLVLGGAAFLLRRSRRSVAAI
jgi:hypothetical protein